MDDFLNSSDELFSKIFKNLFERFHNDMRMFIFLERQVFDN